MVMQVNGNYGNSGADYTEKIREKQAAERAEKTKEAANTAEEKGAAKNTSAVKNRVKILWDCIG